MLLTKSAPTQKRLRSMHAVKKPVAITRRALRISAPFVVTDGLQAGYHLSDRYGYFSILPISPTEKRGGYVLDGLFDQDTILSSVKNSNALILFNNFP